MRSILTASLLYVACISSASAGILSFSGKVYDEDGSAPLANALVMPGVFAAGFDPLTYTFAYGDEVGNLDPDAYSQAVADGNFKPLGFGGSGAKTNANGIFSWVGNTTSFSGEHIWFFVFADNDTNAVKQVLATSTAAHWVTPTPTGSNVTIEASEANQFVMGQHVSDGVAVSFIPVPEPASLTFGIVAILVACCSRRRPQG